MLRNVLDTSLEQEAYTNTDIQESQLKEFESNEAVNSPYKLKHLGGINTQSLYSTFSKQAEPNNDSIPWIILRKDCSNSMIIKKKASIRNEDLSPRLPHENKMPYLKVQISDNGCGIPEDVIPKFFTMFTQSQRSGPTKHRSASLGLWISKQLCQKMGGDITLYSKENEGTTFVFYIPVSIGAQVESIPQDLNISKQPRALVVDDYQFNRDLHRLILEREGVQVSLACDGVEAVREYKKHGNGYFDFVMMDVQMPEMDGFTATKEIREMECERNWKHVDIYFVSGEYYDENEVLAKLRSRERMTEMAQIKCMKKPIDIEVIKKMVERCYKKKDEGAPKSN